MKIMKSKRRRKEVKIEEEEHGGDKSRLDKAFEQGKFG